MGNREPHPTEPWILQLEFPALVLFDSVEEANRASRDLCKAGLIGRENFFMNSYREAPYCIYLDGGGQWFWTAMSFFTDDPDNSYARKAMEAHKCYYSELVYGGGNDSIDVFGLFDQLL